MVGSAVGERAAAVVRVGVGSVVAVKAAVRVAVVRAAAARVVAMAAAAMAAAAMVEEVREAARLGGRPVA